MTALASRNGRTAAMAALVALSMVALAFASVPLYRLFCAATGLGGTTQRASSAPTSTPAGRMISIRFDANVAGGLAWRFEPEETHRQVQIGARSIAFFRARNLTARTIVGRATFNVTPSQAGQYFTKIQCFCFTEQTLRPGQDVRMPVIFFVDRRILQDPTARDIDEITLSYTFYPVDPAESRS